MLKHHRLSLIQLMLLVSFECNKPTCEPKIFGSFLASAGQASKVVLVYFIGGYTLAEVAAFRLMQANLGLQFIIAGTSNISGKSLIKSILV